MARQTQLTALGTQVPRATVAQSPERRSRQRRRNLWIYAFLMPTFVLYGLYTIYPIIASYWYSLVEWNGFSSQMRFVGISNYEAVLADPMFWASVRITLVFMLVVAPLRIFGAFFLAILLNSPKLPFATFFRTAYFIPVVTTTAIVGVVMRFIFDPGAGPVAAVLGVFDLPPVDLLGDSTTTLFTAAIVYVWKFFGITMIYWLAALQTIPRDLFEAARIDGAGGFPIFRNITLPMLLPGTNSFQIPDARGRWAAGNVGFFIDGPWSPGGVRALNEAHLPKMAQAGELTPRARS